MKKYIDPADIISKWEKTGLLEGCHNKDGLALCLQAQIQFNERELDPQFKRISIPVLVRMFSLSEAMRRNHFVTYFEDVAWPNVLTFKTRFAPAEPHNDLQEEADYVAELCQKWSKELDKHFSDMKDREVIFRGIGRLDDGTVLMYYS